MIEDFPRKSRAASSSTSEEHSNLTEETTSPVSVPAYLAPTNLLGDQEPVSLAGLTVSKSELAPFPADLSFGEAGNLPASKQTTQPPVDKSDAEEIPLLRQIFPDLTVDELHRLHGNRLQHSGKKKKLTTPYLNSQLGARVWKQTASLAEGGDRNIEPNCLSPPWQVALPDNFLRLPPSVAVYHTNAATGIVEHRLVADMEQNVLKQHSLIPDHKVQLATTLNYTRVLFRDERVGLGMTICEEAGCIWVHSLTSLDGARWYVTPTAKGVHGPALDKGIHPGDLVLGINGIAFLKQYPSCSTTFNLLQHAVFSMKESQDPVVVHLQHGPPRRSHPLAGGNGEGRFKEADYSSFSGGIHSQASYNYEHEKLAVHPFAAALTARGLITSKSDESATSKMIAQFTNRTREWESNSSFRIHATTYELQSHFDPRDLPASLSATTLPFEYDDAKRFRSYGPSTPTLQPCALDKFACSPHAQIRPLQENLLATDNNNKLEAQGRLGDIYNNFQTNVTPNRPSLAPKKGYPGSPFRWSEMQTPPAKVSLEQPAIFIPLLGVKKALCVRIVNTFVEEERIAYAILVHDIETGREWYAPIRYYRDFHDLRAATILLYQSIEGIPFPLSSKWSLFASKETSESKSVREGKCCQLEHFLRRLCSAVYCEGLHPSSAEIVIHVQSFLGCDTASTEFDTQGENMHLHIQIALNETAYGENLGKRHRDVQMNARLLLKRSIQRYTHRLFLLHTMEQIVDQFVDKSRTKAPKVEEIQALELQGRTTLKQMSLEELAKIRAFLDQIQEIIIEGCSDDLTSIARRDYTSLQDFTEGEKGATYLDQLFRIAVREQIEIEVYVPLRSIVSRLLVNGWKHDDMEIQFKIQELKKRPQAVFRIPAEQQSPSDWQSVSRILEEGVGRSTLPCAKLRAIVEAAKEISRLYGKEQSSQAKTVRPTLGADDFLPIFIYCVVRAEIERPCALCVLLTTLCERTSRIGETGYYLASFEAAITHLQEIDLSEDRINLASPKRPQEYP